ncbi:MAG: hypothetical protein V1921_05275 [Candidatus Altiarchaeota archaeon]
MKEKRILLAEIAALLLLAISVTATGDVSLTVEIENIPPEVGRITVNDLVLSENGTNRVTCDAQVSDKNGNSDILDVKSVLWHSALSVEDGSDNDTIHYSLNESVSSVDSALAKNVTFAYDIGLTAEPGEWLCRITAYDNHTAGSNHSLANVYPIICSNGMLDPEEVDVDCGWPCPPCPVTSPIPQLRISTDKVAVVGDILEVKVTDERSRPVKTEITIIMSDGKTIDLQTNPEGKAYVKVEEAGALKKTRFEENIFMLGRWKIEAERRDYLPVDLQILVVNPVSVSTTILTALILVIIAISVYHPKKKAD